MRAVNIIFPVLLLIPLLVIFGWTPGSASIHGDTVVLSVGWLGLAQFALAELLAVVTAWRWLRVTGVTPGTLLLPGALVCGMSPFVAGALAFRIEASPAALHVRTLGVNMAAPWSAVKSATMTAERGEKNAISHWLDVQRTDGVSARVGLDWLHDSERDLLRLALERYRRDPRVP